MAMKREIDQLLGVILGKDEDKEAMEAIKKTFASFVLPLEFTGTNSAELTYDRDYEQTCHTLSQFTNVPVKSMTVKEFYSLVLYVNNKK